MKRQTVYLLSVLILLTACNNSKPPQTPVSGSAIIVADESLAPIVQDQYDVFSNSYQSAKIKFAFQPENKLLNTFLNDSVDIAIMTRLLTPQEQKIFTRKKIKIRTNRFAIDAIALITHHKSADSVCTVQQIIDVMNGKDGPFRLVFDNANSSTVRYFKTLAGVTNLPAKGVYALQSNAEVVKHVHNNTGSIGVIGVNWIKHPSSDLADMVKQIKILKIKNLPGKAGGNDFYSPSQNNLALGLYPFTRDLYIIDCQGRMGLGTGFASFLASERGQRIVLKSGLLPDSIPTREIIIKK